MRATISFEADVGEVGSIMAAVIKRESDNIRSAAHNLEVGKPHELEDRLGESLEALYKIANQLEQYKNMMRSFAVAKYKSSSPTHLPDHPDSVNSVSEVFEAAQNINKFGNFIDKLNSESAEPDENGEQDDQQSQQG